MLFSAKDYLRALQRFFTFPRVVLLTFLLGTVAVCPTAHATITVLRHYRLGENDPGAVAGGLATNSLNGVGGNDLVFTGNSFYSADVPSTTNGSALSLRFTGTNFGSAPFTNNLTDNFG